MMNQTNLAYKWAEEPEDTLLSQAANAAAISHLLRSKTRTESPVASARPKSKRVVFRDNFSGDFQAFRVY